MTDQNSPDGYSTIPPGAVDGLMSGIFPSDLALVDERGGGRQRKGKGELAELSDKRLIREWLPPYAAS